MVLTMFLTIKVLTSAKWMYYKERKQPKDALLHPTLFNHVDVQDSRKYDTFFRKQAILFKNLLGKGLTQEINGNGGSI